MFGIKKLKDRVDCMMALFHDELARLEGRVNRDDSKHDARVGRLRDDMDTLENRVADLTQAHITMSAQIANHRNALANHIANEMYVVCGRCGCMVYKHDAKDGKDEVRGTGDGKYVYTPRYCKGCHGGMSETEKKGGGK